MKQEATNFKDELKQHFVIDDWQAVDIVLAAVAAHKISGNMLWLRIIGASGSGKTEILRPLMDNSYCAKLETFTQASIRGGLKKDGKESPKLLARLDGKLAITKEFNTILTKNKEDKLEVFGLLRSVHDGEVESDFGSEEGHLHQHVHFDWILGVTQYIDRQSSLEAQLGTRFVDLRWGKPIDHKALVSQALDNDEKIDSIREIMSCKMDLLIKSINANGNRPTVDVDWLADIANLVCIARTPVERDGYTKGKDIISLPDPEAPTRMSQMFMKIIKGLYLIGITDYKPYVIRLAYDNIPTLRCAYIKARMQGLVEGKDISEYMCVSEATISHTKEELMILKFDLNLFNKLITL